MRVVSLPEWSGERPRPAGCAGRPRPVRIGRIRARRPNRHAGRVRSPDRSRSFADTVLPAELARFCEAEKFVDAHQPAENEAAVAVEEASANDIVIKKTQQRAAGQAVGESLEPAFTR